VDAVTNVGTFTLTPPTTSVTANVLGATQTVLYTVNPSGGFLGTVAFSCSGLPSNTACVFSPTTATITGTSPVTTTLSLQLNTGVHVDNQVPPPPGPRLPVITFAALLCLAIPSRLRKILRRLPILFSLIVLAALTAPLTGCGSGIATGLTPAGTYAVTVQATSGTNTQTATINLTITNPL
jgi:hypothetical protein